MAITDAYLVTTKNLKPFFDSLINAQPPQKFTHKFLEQLDFKSTNDRLYLGILKGLGFLDANHTPQKRYFDFIDASQSKFILADGVREAYSDLFAINRKAQEMSTSDVKNKLKTIFEGSKTDHVLSLMANTFKALCEYADFSNQQIVPAVRIQENSSTYEQEEPLENETKRKEIQEFVNKNITTELHYNIQIHLPETRDIAVYDAIFKSLKEHLL